MADVNIPIPTAPPPTRPKTALRVHIFRIAVGGLGGFAAVLVKFLAQHEEKISSSFSNGQIGISSSIIAGLIIVGPILVFLGGLIGWASEETHRIKLLMLGVSAPALITTGLSGQPHMPLAEQAPADRITSLTMPSALQTAHASILPSLHPEFVPLGVGLGNLDILGGIKEILGVDSLDTKYWVIAGSHLTLTEAKLQVQRINEEAPYLRAFVGKKRPGNNYYPVIVGEFTKRSVAEETLAKAVGLNSVGKAYLSDYADRKP